MQAGRLFALVHRLTEQADAMAHAVPRHWTGRTAGSYRIAAAQAQADLRQLAEQVREAALVTLNHEQELRTVQAMMAGAGSTPWYRPTTGSGAT